MKLIRRALLAAILLPPSIAMATDTWECKARKEEECTAIIVTQNGTRVPVTVRKGQKLVRGEGHSVILTSENWNKVSS